MPIFGTLDTMPLSSLIRWLAEAEKSGVLEIERDRRCKAIEFRKGFVGACVSDDPSGRIGQVLLSRGKITKEHLQEALALQEVSHKQLGLTLIEMGVLSQEELARFIATKAEETILGLFDWEDAIFRFHEGATLNCYPIEVTLSASDVLRRGIRHQNELKEIRKVFKSSGLVLRRTDRAERHGLADDTNAGQIFASIDGERTLAEVFLRSHALQFLVLKFLFKLYKDGIVEIVEERPPSSDSPTLLDLPAPMIKHEQSIWKPLDAGSYSESENVTRGPDLQRDADGREAHQPSGVSGDDGSELEVEVALRLIARGDYALALDLLNAAYRLKPGDSSLAQLIDRAETALVKSVGSTLSSPKIPVVITPIEEMAKRQIGSKESFVLGLIDGRTSIKSIIWLSPLREVEALRALQQLLDDGLIALKDAERAEEPAVAETRQSS